MDEGWRRLREAVCDVGRAKMDEPTGAGWTYHDLFAHIAGWHDLTLRRMRVYRAEGRFPEYDEVVGGIAPLTDGHEFNARLGSSHRLVGAEALTDELEQVRANDDWVSSVVGGNTYRHDEEQATERGLR
jgi:hypothetical protein